MSIASFEIHVATEQIDDLRRRLVATRWPDSPRGTGWLHGADLAYMRELVDYWAHSFDWRAQEREMRELKHFSTEIDRHRVHFIHERGESENALPLIITHGWPGSFLEFRKIIPMLTHPSRFNGRREDSFHVVAPSLMGFGFSDRPRKTGANTFWIAGLWRELMRRLGYAGFAAQGGDIGANVSSVLALKYPQDVIAIHLNYIPASYRPYIEPGAVLSSAELEFRAKAEEWNTEHGAYSHVQAKEPQTIGVALNDSPAGLAAWIVSKFREWSDCGGQVEKRFSKDDLLANVSLYWFTETIASSFRLYFESSRAPFHLAKGQRVTPPVGIARFPFELPVPPREAIERGYNVKHWTTMPRGGHFAAAEEPQLMAEDVRRFFRQFRTAE